jgi:hypothetical protein
VYLVLAIAAASGHASYALTQHFDVILELNPPIGEIQTEARELSATAVDELRRGGETFDLRLVIVAAPERRKPGLVTSTLVTLFVIPAFYLSFGKNSIEGQQLWKTCVIAVD